VGVVRFLGTTGLKYLIPFWYAKEPMFWLPQGWFPYYMEWILSFPRAPVGSVSIASWQIACTGFIMLISDMMAAISNLAIGSRVKSREQPIKVDANAKGGKTATPTKPETRSQERSKKDS
jgi:tail-anchored protein insertion receptor